jgi:hypothetical protein
MHARLAGFDACVRACLQAPSSCVSWAFVRVQPVTVCTAIIAPPVPAGRPVGWPAARRASQPWPGRQLRFPSGNYYVGRRGRRGCLPACLPACYCGRPRPRRRPLGAAPGRSAHLRGVPAGDWPGGPVAHIPHPYAPACPPACLRHVTWCPPPVLLLPFSFPFHISHMHARSAALVHTTPHSRCNPSAY